jgi:hypothetical protein
MKRVRSLLEWLCDRNQEDRRVTIGCKTCRETKDLMAATALAAWLPFHETHEIWIKSPFAKRG